MMPPPCNPPSLSPVPAYTVPDANVIELIVMYGWSSVRGVQVVPLSRVSTHLHLPRRSANAFDSSDRRRRYLLDRPSKSDQCFAILSHGSELADRRLAEQLQRSMTTPS